MLSVERVNRRIRVLTRILNGINYSNVVTANNVNSYISNAAVSIGGTLKEIKQARRPEYVPRIYCKSVH